MIRYSQKGLIALMCLWLLLISAQAQDDAPPDDPPIATVVAFVDNSRAFPVASFTDPGADGVERMAGIFRSLGASVRGIRLDEPIPDDVEILVLVRPLRPLSASQTAYIWDFLQRGGHFLLAADPNGYQRVNGERRGRGIDALFTLDYGISLQDNLLFEPFFTVDSIARIENAWTAVQPETFVPNPITEPIIKYELPVYVWGSRGVDVYGAGIDQHSWPLLYTESAYGEAQNLNTPPELNIGADVQGRILTGGMAVNDVTGSRLVLLGDSEMVQNIFGLTRVPNTQQPLFPGNDLLARRLAAWLMGIAPEDYPDIQDGFSWVALDGLADDWDPIIPPVINETIEVNTPAAYTVQSVRSFFNSHYVYLLIEAATDPAPDAVLIIEFVAGNRYRLGVSTTETALIQLDGDGAPRQINVPDAELVIGEMIEVRLPRRLFTQNPTLERVCISGAIISLPECLTEPVTPQVTTRLDPVPVRIDGVMAVTRTNGIVNLRTEPDESAAIIDRLPTRTLFAAVEQTDDGEWTRVINGRYEGWIATFLLGINGELP